MKLQGYAIHRLTAANLNPLFICNRTFRKKKVEMAG